MRTVFLLILAPCLLAGLVAPAAAEEGVPHSVYRAAVDRGKGGYDSLVQALATEAEAAGFEVLSRVEAGKPEDCRQRATVLSLLDRDYAAALLAADPGTAPYAVVDRVNLFTDENGIHASFVNPLCLNRTILTDEPGLVELAEAHAARLTALIRRAVPGTPVERDYGQVRTGGRIGKTLGVAAGGDFRDHLLVQGRVSASDPAAVAGSVVAAFAEPTRKWGLRVVHRADFPEEGFVVLGITGSPLDSRSFEIVGAGGDEARADFSCPGLSHAAAYPLEVIVRADGDGVRVETVESSFRMKMFLEDAGTWAFLTHMRVPGSIGKELEETIKRGFEAL